MTFPERLVQQGDRSFAFMAAMAAIASLPLAASNLLAMLATVHFNLGGMTNPLVLLHAGAAEVGLWRWSMVLDIVGYYLPIIPLILFLPSSLRMYRPLWTDLFALCLLSYCLIGAIGGAELATALPTLIKQYAISPSHRPGPLGVHPGVQGQGVGASLLQAFLSTVDEAGEPAFLETDIERNVIFYQCFGFEVVENEVIVGVNTRFMWRPAVGPCSRLSCC